MSGRCEARPNLVGAALPLSVEVPALRTGPGAGAAEELFGPLGWSVETHRLPLDPAFPDWGDSPYVQLRLTGTLRLADALSHLYVLLPVLDGVKHYAVTPDEVDKLLRAGAGWLEPHPARTLITTRYLRRRSALVRSALEQLERLALERLAEVDDTVVDQLDDAVPTDPEQADPETGELPPARPPSLARLRIAAILEVLQAEGVSSVLDLGCGEGALLQALVGEPRFTRLVGVDVSPRALAVARRRLRLRDVPQSRADELRGERLELFQSALTYRDRRLEGFDAAVLQEVVEHVDPPRLAALEDVVFAGARPTVVIVTTPNAEYNPLYPFLAPGQLRHRDHRFEWTRAEFAAWVGGVAERRGYAVRVLGIGDEDETAGHPTQCAVFTRAGAR
jgi:3' terminal RNA ribose 2'-O-methyltransferase Hen1